MAANKHSEQIKMWEVEFKYIRKSGLFNYWECNICVGFFFLHTYIYTYILGCKAMISNIMYSVSPRVNKFSSYCFTWVLKCTFTEHTSYWVI